jgi:NitT/TauT family transport system ATP-binding protein
MPAGRPALEPRGLHTSPPPPGAEPEVQAIPQVPPRQILGLLSTLEDSAPGASVYSLANAIGRKFEEVIALVTAAELLGFVETPDNEVRLTALGLRFHEAHRGERGALFAVQLQKLGLFRHVLELLEASGPLAETRALEELSAALPYDNPQQLLHTLVAWGRYAGLPDYDFTGKRLLLLGAGGAPRA